MSARSGGVGFVVVVVVVVGWVGVEVDEEEMVRLLGFVGLVVDIEGVIVGVLAALPAW